MDQAWELWGDADGKNNLSSCSCPQLGIYFGCCSDIIGALFGMFDDIINRIDITDQTCNDVTNSDIWESLEGMRVAFRHNLLPMQRAT